MTRSAPYRSRTPLNGCPIPVFFIVDRLAFVFHCTRTSSTKEVVIVCGVSASRLLYPTAAGQGVLSDTSEKVVLISFLHRVVCVNLLVCLCITLSALPCTGKPREAPLIFSLTHPTVCARLDWKTTFGDLEALISSNKETTLGPTILLCTFLSNAAQKRNFFCGFAGEHGIGHRISPSHTF